MNRDADRLRVLLVEDNFLAAMSLHAILKRLGCDVTGPVATVERGEAAAAEASFDVAFLDITLLGGTSCSVAETLIERGCHVVFVTGYTSTIQLPPTLAGVPVLRKPIDEDSIRNALVGYRARLSDGAIVP